MGNITQEDFKKKAKSGNYQIIDVRRPDECAEGIINDAKTIDFMNNGLFLSEIEKLDKAQPYLIYCRSGNRSGKACETMNSMGFEETNNFIGGIMGWQGELSF